jgi:hypothetical protein
VEGVLAVEKSWMLENCNSAQAVESLMIQTWCQKIQDNCVSLTNFLQWRGESDVGGRKCPKNPEDARW